MEHTQASELCLAAFSGNAKVVNMLLTTVGVDVNASDCGMNALVRASIAGKVDIVKLLLSHKADVNLADMVRYFLSVFLFGCPVGNRSLWVFPLPTLASLFFKNDTQCLLSWD